MIDVVLVTRIVRSPVSSTLFAFSGEDTTVRLFDRANSEVRLLGRHEGSVCDLVWSETGILLVSCGVDGSVCVWDTQRVALLRMMKAGSSPAYCVSLHPTNNNLVFISTREGVHVLNLSTGKEVAMIVPHGVRALAWVGSDNPLLLCACVDGVLRVASSADITCSSWSWRSESQKISARSLAWLAVSKKSDLIAISAMDATLHLFSCLIPPSLTKVDLSHELVFPILIRDHVIKPHFITMGPEDEPRVLVVSGGEDGRICVYERQGSAFTTFFEASLSGVPILDLEISETPSGLEAYCVDSSGTLFSFSI